MGHLPNVFRDINRVAKEVVWCVRVSLARPGQIDYRIYCDVGNVDTQWSGVTGHRFSQDTLGGFSRRKTRKTRFASIRGGVAGADDTAPTRFNHRGHKLLPKMQQRHGIDLKILPESLGVHVEEVAKSATHCVVYHHLRVTQGVPDGIKNRVQRGGVSNVTGVSFAVRQFRCERVHDGTLASQHGNLVVIGKSADDGASRSGAYAGYQADGFGQNVVSMLKTRWCLAGLRRPSRPQLADGQLLAPSGRCGADPKCNISEATPSQMLSRVAAISPLG